jgi:hypothetical protein
MEMMKELVLCVICASIIACAGGVPKQDEQSAPQPYVFRVTGLSEGEYPDDPDLGHMAAGHDHAFLDSGVVGSSGNGYDFRFFRSRDRSGPAVELRDIDLLEFMPSIPQHLRQDPYLARLAVVNQEWNRNQVRFERDEFIAADPAIVRVDLARNCLNAYLWEVILFKEEMGAVKPFSHGWFDFPKALYTQLFEERNGVPFSTYKASLEHWADPTMERVDHAQLVTILDSTAVSWRDLSDAMYPLVGARERKYKEIITPWPFNTMRDLQTDSATFATFSPPGYYNRADPRHTQLGRIAQLDRVERFTVRSMASNEELQELRLSFTDISEERRTTLVIGGLDLGALPLVASEDVEKGWRNSMGFSNHTFYESYGQHVSWHSNTDPYYAYLIDEDGRWLDSHTVGIDGPVMYRDIDDPETLHLWLLSFERHAFVGHYTVRTLGIGNDRTVTGV